MAEEAAARGAAGGSRLPLIVGGVVVLALIAGVWMWLSRGKESHRRCAGRGAHHADRDARRRHGRQGRASTDNQYVEAGTVVAADRSARLPGRRRSGARRARRRRSDRARRRHGRADRRGLDAQRRAHGRRRRRGGAGRHRASPTARSRRRRRSWSPSQARLREREATAVKNAQGRRAAEAAGREGRDRAAAVRRGGRRGRRGPRRGRRGEVRRRRRRRRRSPSPSSAPCRPAPARRRREAGAAVGAHRRRSSCRSPGARAPRAEARVQQMQAALAQAELNLERTTIKAPTAGIVSRKSVEVGAGRAAGPAAARAGLARRRLGRRQLQGDAARRRCATGSASRSRSTRSAARTFNGQVDSLAAATGAKFSLLPPENATGNYVKVVQRVPVKIVLDPGQDPEHLLRPGHVRSADGAHEVGAMSAEHTPRQPVDRRDRRHVRDVHGGAGHDRRQRVAAAHRRQPVGDDRRIDLGADLVPRRQRDRPAADRLAGEPLRPQAAADDVGHRLHDRVAAVRPRAEPAAARRCSG